MGIESIKKRVEALVRVIDPANNATEGERENARVLLDKLLEKHNLKPEDFAEDRRKMRWFTYATKIEKRLLAQIVCHVLSVKSASYYPTSPKRGGFMLTDAEYLDISTMYKALKKQWVMSLEDMLTAFMSAQGLLRTSTEEEEKEEPSIEMMMRWERIRKMKVGIPKIDVKKTLRLGKETK